MTVRNALFAVMLALGNGCSQNPYVIEYQLRTPTTEPIGADTIATLVQDGGSSSPRDDRSDHHFEDGYIVYRSSETVCYDWNNRSAIVVETGFGVYEAKSIPKVFVLPFNQGISRGDWTEWMKPNYLQPHVHNQAGWWLFLVGDDSGKLPVHASTIELRYRLKDFGPATGQH